MTSRLEPNPHSKSNRPLKQEHAECRPALRAAARPSPSRRQGRAASSASAAPALAWKRRLSPPRASLLTRPTDKVFPGNHVKLFNRLLEREKLKVDRDGNARTAYSLRHTYICLRWSRNSGQEAKLSRM